MAIGQTCEYKKFNLVYIEVPFGVIFKKDFCVEFYVFVLHQIFPLFKRQINETTTVTHFKQSIRVNSFGKTMKQISEEKKTVHVVFKYMSRSQCWNFKTIYESQNRNRVVVPAREATQAGGINTLESIPGLLKKILKTVLDVERGGGGRGNFSLLPVLPLISQLIRGYFS